MLYKWAFICFFVAMHANQVVILHNLSLKVYEFQLEIAYIATEKHYKYYKYKTLELLYL